MGYSGSVEGGMLSKRPTEEGLLALELFHGFVTHVDAFQVRQSFHSCGLFLMFWHVFQDCVETYSATELGAKLKLERHLLDAVRYIPSAVVSVWTIRSMLPFVCLGLRIMTTSLWFLSLSLFSHRIIRNSRTGNKFLARLSLLSPA